MPKNIYSWMAAALVAAALVAAPGAEAAVSKTSKRVFRDTLSGQTASNFTARARSTSSIEWSWSTGTFSPAVDGFYLYTSSVTPALNGRISLSASTSFYIDTGLRPNQAVTRWLTAHEGGVEGSDTEHFEKYTHAQPPPTPNLSQVTSTSAYLTWHYSSATAYAIEGSTNSGVSYYRIRDSFVPWQTLDLLSNKAYWIRIGAVNGDNELSPSTFSAIAIATTPPLDLGMTAVAVSSYAITWSWSTGTLAATGISGYRIYYSTISEDGGPAEGETGQVKQAVAGAGTSSWTEYYVDIDSETLSADSQHARWIKAVGILESSGRTITKKFTYAVAPATCTPVEPHWQNVFETSINLNWNPSPASAYVIEYASATQEMTQADFAVLLGTAVVSGPSSVSGLEGNTKHDFRIGAVNGDGEQTPDDAFNPMAYSQRYKTLTRPPATTVSCTAITDTSLKWSWSTGTYTGTSYIDGYLVGIASYTEALGNFVLPLVYISSVTSTDYTMDYLLTNSTHTRYVWADQGNPATAYYSFGGYAVPTTCATFATPPNDVSFSSVRSSTVTIMWNEPEVPASAYRVERATTVGQSGPWVFLSSVTGSSYEDSGLTPYTTYAYRIGAINRLGFQTLGMAAATGGNRRDYSFVSSTITTHISPTLYGVAIGTGAIAWSWTDAMGGVTGYNLYTGTSGVIATGLAASATHYTEVSLSSANARIYRRLRSVTAATGIGDYSEAQLSTLALPPASPSITSSSTHRISLGWTANGSARYGLYRSEDGANWSQLKTWTDVFVSTWYSDTGLRFATTYYYAVRGYNDDGIVSVASSIPAGLSMTLPVPSTYTTVFATAAASQDVTAALPGFGQVTVTLPAGVPDGYFAISTRAATEPIETTKANLDAATAKLSGSSLLTGAYVELRLLDAFGAPLTSNLASPARVTITYTDANADDIVDGTAAGAATLRIFSLDPAVQVWNQIRNSVLNRTARTVHADLPHFSIYALGSVTSAAGLIADVFAYPNPYRPGTAGLFGQSVFGDGVVFESLPAGSKIKIYTLSGAEVASFSDADGDGRAIWDTRNKDGAKAASGVYLYLVTVPGSSDRKTGRVAIIR